MNELLQQQNLILQKFFAKFDAFLNEQVKDKNKYVSNNLTDDDFLENLFQGYTSSDGVTNSDTDYFFSGQSYSQIGPSSFNTPDQSQLQTFYNNAPDFAPAQPFVIKFHSPVTLDTQTESLTY